MTQLPSKAKVDRQDAAAARRSPRRSTRRRSSRTPRSQGNYTIDGALFGGQVKLDKRRRHAPEGAGHHRAHRPRALRPRPDRQAPRHDERPEADAATRPRRRRSAASSRARSSSTASRPTTSRMRRRASRRDACASRAAARRSRYARRPRARRRALGPPIVISLADDAVQIPPVTFDLAAPNGFKGAFAVKGAVNKVTRGGELALDAELSPIDLGILVGIVPQDDARRRARSADGAARGKATQPEFDGSSRSAAASSASRACPAASPTSRSTSSPTRTRRASRARRGTSSAATSR